MSSENEARVEAYLDEVLTPLARNLSPFHRNELRRELRAHLWERVDAYLELGQSNEDAVTEALRQFGGAGDFLRQWRQEWLTVDRSNIWWETLAAARPAIRLSVPTLLLTWVTARILGFVLINALPGTYLGALAIAYVDVLSVAFGVGFFGLSLWVGLAQGRLMPRRSGMGMFAALGTVITGGSALYWLGTMTGLDRTFLGGFFTSLPLMAAAWLPTACLAAALSSWHTQRKRVSA